MVAPFLLQLWVSLGVLFKTTGTSIMFSYAWSLYPGILEDDFGIKADGSIMSWFGPGTSLAYILGVLMSSYLMGLCGRRLSFALGILPGTISWIVIYFAKNTTTFMIGLLLGGFAAGVTDILGAIVLGEFTSPENRGMFLLFKLTALHMGGLYDPILGRFINWRTRALYALTHSVVAFFVVLTWPESPTWLASKGRFDQCAESFIWLRGKSERAMQELGDLIDAQKRQLSTPSKNSFLCTVKLFFMKFTRKDFTKPLIIVILSGIMSLVSESLVYLMMSYIQSEEIMFTEYFYHLIRLYFIVMSLVVTATSVLSSVLVRFIPRRTYLFATGISSLLVLTIKCMFNFFYTDNSHPSKSWIIWISMAMFMVYYVLANMYCIPMPTIIIGEIIPVVHKGIGAAVIGVTLTLLDMGRFKFTSYITTYLNIYLILIIYGILTALLLLLMYFVLPETKNETLQKIENDFNNGSQNEYVNNEQTRKKISSYSESYHC